MKFTLPLPPTLNHTYAVSRTARHPMFKKKTVKDWEFTAGWDLKKQLMDMKGQKTFTGNVKVGLTFYYRVNRDIDASIKVLLDLLQKQQVVVNDRQIRKIMYIDIFQDVQKPRVEVVIYEM